MAEGTSPLLQGIDNVGFIHGVVSTALYEFDVDPRAVRYVLDELDAALTARSEPRAEGLRLSHQCGDCGATWAEGNRPPCHAATPPAEGPDVERLRVAAERVLNARGVISHARALDELRAALAARSEPRAGHNDDECPYRERALAAITDDAV